MRLAISNIAWDVSEDQEIARLLRRYDIDAIDVAPAKYFTDLATATGGQIRDVRNWWKEQGIEITGMQALLFGTSGLNLFGSRTSRSAMLRHLGIVCEIGAALGATRLVFGSPKNRDRGNLAPEAAVGQALPFFYELGEIARSKGVVICLEPNPPRYGCNFMTSSAEAAQFVERVGHQAIRLQFDTSTLTINEEDPQQVLEKYAALIGHIHASEPDLVPLGDGQTDHQRVAEAIAQSLPHHIVSIEMVASKDVPHPISIERALRVAIRYYRAGE